MRVPPPVSGRSAWIGAELAHQPESWTYRLTPIHLAEIAAATAALGARNTDIAAITRADAPLATLGPTLDRLRNEVLNGRAFVLPRNLPVAGRPIADSDSATACWGTGSYFGNARFCRRRGRAKSVSQPADTIDPR